MTLTREVSFALFKKQRLAFHQLTDDATNELVYGGGARGGKSFLGCFWIITSAMSMQGSSWLIAREELKRLKQTTMRTFFKVLGLLGLKKDVHYKYNAQDMVLTFINGSVVFFAELKRVPSDPEFDRIGSYDLTGGWLDEAQEICKDAKDALQFRYTVTSGRGWETIPKTLYTCNPSKGWIYQDFWRPIIKEGIDVEGCNFITALYTDNPYINHEQYRKNVLRTGNKIKIERLLHGNFEYDDDETRLFEFDAILDMFTNQVATGEKFLSADIARFGSDKTVAVIWDGLMAKKIITKSKLGVNEVVPWLEELGKEYGIRRSHMIVDEDGVGGGVKDFLTGCKGFVNGSKPLKPYGQDVPNYANLKTQCYYEFARLVNEGKIGIEDISLENKELLIEELEQVKEKDPDKDNKVQLVGKDKIKEIIGRSPDIADALMMRMYYEIKKPPILKPIII